MRSFKFTLLCDGTSDKVLVPIIHWMLDRHAHKHSRVVWNSEFADLSRAPRRPKGLRDKIGLSFDLFPADVLFVHRDAENMTSATRIREIQDAVDQVRSNRRYRYNIPLVPIRMTEAWLLISEEAIRRAAGNPNGDSSLCLPHVNVLESLPDPKSILETLLRTASGRHGRRLKKFNFPAARQLVPNYIRDWSPLLQLSAVRELDDRIRTISEEILAD